MKEQQIGPTTFDRETTPAGRRRQATSYGRCSGVADCKPPNDLEFSGAPLLAHPLQRRVGRRSTGADGNDCSQFSHEGLVSRYPCRSSVGGNEEVVKARSTGLVVLDYEV